MEAIRRQDLPKVYKLIVQGIFHDPQRFFNLFCLFFFVHVATIFFFLLISTGADVNTKEPEKGETPIHLAVRTGNVVRLVHCAKIVNSV